MMESLTADCTTRSFSSLGKVRILFRTFSFILPALSFFWVGGGLLSGLLYL